MFYYEEISFVSLQEFLSQSTILFMRNVRKKSQASTIFAKTTKNRSAIDILKSLIC